MLWEEMVVKYEIPERWLKYDGQALVNDLAAAKAAVISLTMIPYQRSWAEKLQAIQLKTEAAGTSRIEGAEFTERELIIALHDETPEALLNRSQRQARAAINTYRWIAALPVDRPINSDLIKETHRRIVTGWDDDHCLPGQLRSPDQNVVFGSPRHRGVEGGAECEKAFARFCAAIQGEFREHDTLIQALATHYHIGVMHPFLDGIGRTARAVEALILQRAGLKDELFIAMSNYYYEEKSNYLAALGAVRASDPDLTPFLRFGLRGIEQQCRRVFDEIRLQVSRSLFRDVMYDLFDRLASSRRRVIAERQIKILKRLLDVDRLEFRDLQLLSLPDYTSVKNPRKALIRDIQYLLDLKAIKVERVKENKFFFTVRLEWATQVTETEFFESSRKLPRAKTYDFLH